MGAEPGVTIVGGGAYAKTYRGRRSPLAGGSSRGSLCRARGRHFFRWRQEQVGRNLETGAQSLHHRHAQPLFTPKDLTDAARCSQDRDHVRTAKTVLIHEVADQINRARRPARPFTFLMGGD